MEFLDEKQRMTRQHAIRAAGDSLQKRTGGRAELSKTREKGPAYHRTRIVQQTQEGLTFSGAE